MKDVIVFTPRAGVEAAENVMAFIDLCKNKLTVFGKDLDWESNNWPVMDYINKPGIKTRLSFCFSNFATSGNRTKWKPMAEPFLNFAKGKMRYDFGFNKHENHSQKLAAIRTWEKALTETSADSIPRVENTNPHVLNLAAEFLQDSNPGSAYNSGCYLEKMGKFLNENQMVRASFQWRNPIKKKEDERIKIGKEADEKKKQKLPSRAAIRAIPQIFDLSVDPRDIVISSMSAVMFSSPDRFNEVFRLLSMGT